MVRTILVVLVGVALAAPSARANPVSVTLAEADLRAAVAALPERLEEPTGLLATADVPALKLRKGDLVRGINGVPPSRLRFGLDPSVVYYLDVLRGTKTVVVRVAITPAPREYRTERAWFKERVARLRSYDPTLALQQATKNGQPSGAIVGQLFGFGEVDVGDLIRKVDGKPVRTVDEAFTAIEAGAANPQIVLEVERVGEPFTFTIRLEDPPQADPAIAEAIAKIKKVNATTYVVPKALVAALVNNPMAFAKGARIVPAIKNGKPDGFKLYAIRPSSVYAALGLTNGDTIQSINGERLDSADRALEVYTKLKTAKSFKLELVRRGKPLTLVWKLGK